MKILIGGAWPYANGSLHIGHIAALLPGDVLARYHRAKGDEVTYVSGSDCHGTPVAIRAAQEGKTPEEISDFYHEEFRESFGRLGFSYDRYGKTSSGEHKQFVRAFHKKMYRSGLIYKKKVPQAYCENCKTFLADRFVVGVCPHCKSPTRADQCDACGSVLEPESLSNPACAVCGAPPVFKEDEHLYIALSRMEKELTQYLGAHPGWRKNAQSLSYRYISEGLKDRAVTRSLSWGIDVPAEGFEHKKIYIWAENVLGYLSMSDAVCRERGLNFDELWGENARHYYVHGKDNIPFHTIILPALLIAHGGGLRLPDEILSSEYLTLEGRKISTSRNWAVWVKDIADRFQPDSLRYFLIINGPERRDTDFTFREYVFSHNGELLGAYGNFINRTLQFVHKYYGGVLPGSRADGEILDKTARLFSLSGEKIEQGRFREALEEIFEAVRGANRYFDTEKPWAARTEDPERCANTIFTCVQLIANFARLLAPFLPFSSKKLFSWLNLGEKWQPASVPAGYGLPPADILFARIEKKTADEESAKLLENH